MGDPDTSTSNTSMEMERSEQMSDDDEFHVTNQEEVRDSWEEDSILENKMESENDQNSEVMGDKEYDDSRSESIGDTIIPSKSMDTGNKEYDPTTTDSEESLVSAKGEKMRNKNKQH